MDGMCSGPTQVHRLPQASWWLFLGAPKLPNWRGWGRTGGSEAAPASSGEAVRSGSELDATSKFKSIVRGSRPSPVLPWQLSSRRCVILWLLPLPGGD